MEYIAYSIFYFATLFFILKPVDYNKTYFKIIWFSVLIFYSFSIRLDIMSLYGGNVQNYGDITNYVRIMMLDEISFNIPLFQREFIFYNLTRYLYVLFKNPVIVFLILDLILFIFLFKSLKTFFNINCKKVRYKHLSYIFFMLLLFFPFINGMTNVYRQLFGFVIFFNALNFIFSKKYFLGFLFFIISIFIHNIFLIFFPLLLLMFKSKFLNFFSYILVLFFGLGLTAVLQMDFGGFLNRDASLEIEIGENIAQLIFYVLVLIMVIYYSVDSHIKFENKIFNNFFILNTCIYFIFMINLNSLSSLRISYTIFFLIIPYLILLVDTSFKQKTLSRLIFFHLSLIPLLIL